VLVFNCCDFEHVRAVVVCVEPVGDGVGGNRRREGPEALAVLNLQIHDRLHFGRSRVTENGPSAKRPRTEFHTSIEPSNHGTVGQSPGDLGHQLVIANPTIRCAHGFKTGFNGGLIECFTEIGAAHSVSLIIRDARLV